MKKFLENNFIDILLGLCIIFLCFLSLELEDDKDSLKSKINELSDRLVESDKDYNSLLTELNDCKDERERYYKDLEKIKNKPKHPLVIQMEGLIDEIPCRFKTEAWAARIEGKAGVLPGTFKRISKMRKSGLNPDISSEQAERLLKAVETTPYPKECK